MTKTIPIDSLLKKLALLLIGLFSLVAIFFMTNWFFGNAIAERATTKDLAEIASYWAPNDPESYNATGRIFEESFLPQDQKMALSSFEKAVSLSPFDYQLWLSLGKAREQRGDIAGSKLAMMRALELAPNNANAHWLYGNVLLREGSEKEAFDEIRKAVDGYRIYAASAATMAWDIYDGNTDAVKRVVGDSPEVQSALAQFLAQQKRFDEAFEIWQSLPPDRIKTDFKDQSKRIAQALYSSKQYRKSLQIESLITEGDSGGIELERITNGSFEKTLKLEKADNFDWRLAKGLEPQISLSSQNHSGTKSLALEMDTIKKAEFRKISQAVAVESGKTYAIEFFYKSDLDSKATMKWDVIDLGSRKPLISTPLLEAQTGWTRVRVEFTVGEESEGIEIRLVRDGCSSAVCPIAGKIWFDDFAIKPIESD